MKMDSGFTLSLLLVLVSSFAVQALVKETHCAKPTNTKLKQLQILQVVSSINKPVPAEIRDSTNIIDKSKLRNLGQLSRREVFSLFDARYWNETSQVLELLLEAKTFDDFIKRSEVIKPLVNEELFFYAFSVAFMHRKDTQGLSVPRVHMVFPDKFLKTPVIQKLKQLTYNAERYGKSPIVEGNDFSHVHNYLDTHDELSYFTEDLGMNSHHYHWHVVNPAIWKTKYGNYSERKGELFYWMHSQMVARYDIERLSNNLPRVTPFQSFDDEIDEGYNPHLTMAKTQYHYAYRPPHFVLQDLPTLPKSKLQQWSDSLFHAIHTRQLTRPNRSKVSLNNTRGIDHLANTIEANYDSVNYQTYGNLHCYAHVIAAKITDPTTAYHEDNGVMYDVATSARDPLFYRWHKFLNKFFTEHKKTLIRYSEDDLKFPDVKVDKVSVQNQGSEPNLIRTYWQDAHLKVREGFLFTRQSSAYVKVTHLDHENFNYRIDVTNSGGPHEAVVRIFLAPVYDEFERPLDIKHQRPLMIQMDKFLAKLTPGKNTIVRSSQNSTVTMDSRSIFDSDYHSKSNDNCRCGWPDYLLVPKGNYEGMKFQLFVMLSDWAKDEDTHTKGSCFCKDSLAYCGGIDAKHRDVRAMGFPYDRRIKAESWEEWETDNIAHTTITIKFVGDELHETHPEHFEY